MRRGVASLIMGLSLLVASVSWAGFVMSRTVLDPGRSERLADHLLDNTEVREAIVGRLADALEAQVPPDVPVTRQTLELAATVALEDPRVEGLVRDGIVRAHQNALNGVDEPIVVDATVVGQATRDALVGQIPALDLVLPAAPPVQVEVPGAGLSWLGRVKAFIDRWTLIGAAVAVIGMTAAFVLARNRPAALRRVAFWAFGSSAFWLLVGYGLPALLGMVAPSSVVVATATVDVFFGAMVGPAVTLALIGAALTAVSFVWPSYSRRRPAAALDRAARSRPVEPRYQRAPGGGAPSWPTPPPSPRPPSPEPAPVLASETHRSGGFPTPERPGTWAGAEATTRYPQILSGDGPLPDGPTTGDPSWVPGVGYLDDDRAPAEGNGEINGANRDR